MYTECHAINIKSMPTIYSRCFFEGKIDTFQNSRGILFTATGHYNTENQYHFDQAAHFETEFLRIAVNLRDLCPLKKNSVYSDTSEHGQTH